MSRSINVVEKTKGPVVPINICFNADATVDFEAVRDYAGLLSTNGVPVILLTSGSSEYAWLSEKDVWRITEVIAEAIQGRSLFIAASGSWDVNTCAAYLKHADAVGADAVKIQPNPLLSSEREIYFGYFDHIREGSDIPLFLLDPPLALAIEMASDEQIVGAKVHSHADYYSLTRATRDLNFATICAGQMGNMVFGHQIGSPAYLCPIAPFLPRVALEFFEKIEAGRYDDAIEFVSRYEVPWMETAIDVGWLHAVKEAIRLVGFYPNNRLAPPQRATTIEQSKRVHDALQEVFGQDLLRA
ncbi:MAG: dihydrodipicolinate synthase family protein [SAR202 cluster bacterium]|jgi:dihydrodipicolinate synthase/N-acetylneuraminate lyase|nr:dihydrodipicolinate synthase family protein [SAR202 cluster bacterium]